MPSTSQNITGRRPIAPCFKCTERIPATADTKSCHSTCEAYIEFRKNREEELKARFAKNDTMYYTIDHIRKVQTKIAKSGNKWGNGEG